MFGIGTPELLVILIVALVVVGPQRLPELGRTIGRALREIRKVQDEVRGMVKTEIGDDIDDVRREIRGTAGELRRVSKDIKGGVGQATDVTPLFPSKKRGPHRTPRAPAASADPTDAAPTTKPPTEGSAASAPTDPTPEMRPTQDPGSTSSERSG